ncbi:MAG: enoyl-CoA hydratase [Alphaproteobacteria bacterium]|nr:enoyl-CoA hydratase [Alphaproteobacteria bacterium]
MAAAGAYEFIKTETDGKIFIVTINRPDVLNCLHPMANQEMGRAFDEFAANSDLWVAIVTGAGPKAFSAGNDLKFAASGQKSPMPASGFGGLTARYDLMKPVIAAVNGVAMGGGFEIALACDMIIAAENARFALPEPRVGFAALASGLHRLPRQVPLKKAMGMMLTGRHVKAREGLDIGFVTDLVAEGKAVDAAKQWAAQILECSPMAIRATKEAAIKGLDIADFRTAFETKFDGIQRLLASADHKEGPRAFAEKRKPVWKNEY